jgi:hypothetical protein
MAARLLLGAILKATTDREGRATFTIDREGAWLVKTVHMVRLPQPGEAEWEASGSRSRSTP